MKEAQDAIEKLTQSEKYAVVAGVTYSAHQRIRLIEKGIAPAECRGAPSLARRNSYQSHHWAVPLTELGKAVKGLLLGALPTSEEAGA